MVRTSGSTGGDRLRRKPYAVAAIGDSRIAAIYQDGAQARSVSALSPLNMANALLGQRLVIGGSQWGVAGERTDQMLARIDAAVASGAGTLYIQGGVNDLAQGYAGTAAAANIVTMAERGRRAGMTVVIEAEVGAAFTGADVLGRLADLNRALRDYADATPGVWLHDAGPVVLDPAITSNGYINGCSYDGTHPNARGAYRWGKSLAALLSTIVSPRAGPLLRTRWEADPANGRRQLAVNPTFATASGGTLQNGATGTVPASWQAGPNVSGPGLAVSTAATALGNSVTLDASFTAADQSVRLSQEVPVANWTAGDTVQMVADVEIVTPGALAGVYGVLDVNVAGTSYTSYALFTPSSGGTIGYYAPDEPCRLTLATRPFVVPAGAKGWMIASLRGVARAAGNATARVNQCAIVRRRDRGY